VGNVPTSTIGQKTLEAQPILFIRRSIAWEEIPDTIADCLGTIAAHCQLAGISIAGHPFSRYASAGTQGLTIEVGMPLAAPVEAAGEIEAGILQAGPVIVAVHAGGYEGLQDTYQAIERWAKERGHHSGGPFWESYLTDPEEHPDPADWRTEVFWPIAHQTQL